MRRTFRYYLPIFLFSILCSFQAVLPIVIGSDSVASREAFVEFPAADSNNKILGFAALENGFALEDNTTTCTFNGFFAVSGPIMMNGGSLYLERDLVLSNVVTMTNIGDFYGASHAIEFPTGFSTLGSASNTMFYLHDIELLFNSNVSINNTLCFKGDCVVDGRGHMLDLGLTGSIAVGASSTLLIKNAVLKGISNNDLYTLDNTGKIILQNVTWVQSGNFDFTTGSLDFSNDVVMKGSYVFAYKSSQASTIQSGATLLLDKGFTFSYDSVDSSLMPLVLEDDDAVLRLHGASLHTTVTGIQLTKGKLLVTMDSSISSEVDKGIIFGNSVSEDDLVVDIMGVALNVAEGVLSYKNVNASSWSMINPMSELYMFDNTKLNVYENLPLGNGYLVLGSNTTIARASGKNVSGSIRPLGSLTYTGL